MSTYAEVPWSLQLHGVLSVAAVFGPHCVLGLSGPAKDSFSGTQNIELTGTRVPHFKQKPVSTHQTWLCGYKQWNVTKYIYWSTVDKSISFWIAWFWGVITTLQSLGWKYTFCYIYVIPSGYTLIYLLPPSKQYIRKHQFYWKSGKKNPLSVRELWKIWILTVNTFIFRKLLLYHAAH